jgi:uncharacterized protein YdaU (DUF1376 family)
VSDVVAYSPMPADAPPKPARRPWFKFCPDDWLADPEISAMSAEQEGAYHRLLCYAWKSEPACTLPNDQRTLAKLSRLERRWTKLAAAILAQFEETDGGARLRNRKQYRAFCDMVETHDKLVEGGRRGGNAKAARSQSPSQATARLQPDSSQAVARLCHVDVDVDVDKRTTTTSAARSKRKAADREKHWAQPLADAWEQKFGAGSFPWSKHVRALATLGEMPKADVEALGAAFARYLEETEARFASLPAFLAKRMSYLEPQPSGDQDDRDVAYAEAHGGIWDYERGQLTDAGDLITNPDREQERARKVGAWRSAH